MAKEVDASGPGANGVTILRLVGDVTVSLQRLSDAANVLRHLSEASGAVDLAGVLAKIGRHGAQLDQRIARLAPHTDACVSDVAGDLSDTAQTLVTRWDGLVASRRASLVDLLFARCAELAVVLAAVSREASREAPTAAPPPTSTAQPRPARPPKGSAAHAWEEWNTGACADGAAVCMRLSEPWIEGTGAQLARNERLPSSAWSNMSEVAARVRHHLVLLAGGEAVSYLDALATARHRVVEELRGSVDPVLSPAVRRTSPTPGGRRRARPRGS